MKIEVLVDYYNLDTNRLDCQMINVSDNGNVSLAIERQLGVGVPIDELTIYIEDKNPLHVEYPYYSSAILEYVFVAMCNGGATAEEFEEFKKQNDAYHNDNEADKEFICKMIMKYVDFN